MINKLNNESILIDYKESIDNKFADYLNNNKNILLI